MRLSVVRTSLFGYGTLFLITLLLAWLGGQLQGMFPRPTWPETPVHALIGVVLAIAVLAAGSALTGTFEWARRMEREFELILGGIRTKDALVLAVASGLVEEAFFRGLMQPYLGLTMTSVVFGLLHYPVNRNLIPWTVIAVAMGFAFGIVYRETGSLLAVALAHGLINFVELRRLGRSVITTSSDLDTWNT